MSKVSFRQCDSVPTDEMLSCIFCKNMLQDPVLLACLHNACSPCVDKHAAQQGNSKHITCSSCCVVTDITLKKTNALIAAQVQHANAQRAADTCGLCQKDEKSEEMANAWCIQCQLALCVGCLSEHRKHVQHVCIVFDENTKWSELLKVPSRSCQEHGTELQLGCFTCERSQCMRCAASCYKASHDVHFPSDLEAGTRLLKIKERIETLIATLTCSSDVLHRHTRLPDDVQAAYGIHLDMLKTAKKSAMDAVSAAYDSAERALKDCYDSLQAKASVLRDSAGLLKQRVSTVSSYSLLVSSSSDTIGLLSQLHAVESQLHALVKELSEVKVPLEVSKLVKVNVRLPVDLDLIAASWMGLPRLCADDLCNSPDAISVNDDQPCYISKQEMLEKERKELEDKASKQQDEYKLQIQQLETKHEELQKKEKIVAEVEKRVKSLQDLYAPLSFGPMASSWQVPSRCFDVAVTAEGHMLAAEMEQGLKEYDVSGKEMSCWKPKEKRAAGTDDEVVTVDVLDDERVAVGLFSNLVVLLQRAAASGSGWVESKRISVLQSPPRRLAAHADLLVVCADRLFTGANRWQAGSSQLVLVKLCCGQELHRRKLDYDICSVALTAKMVVTCSNNEVELADGNKKYVVEGHSQSGNSLWRHLSGNKVKDACFGSSLSVLYLAVSGDNKITAINAENGVHLKDIIACSSQGLTGLYALSLKPSYVAVISRDEKEVPRKLSLYPVSSSS